jgi:hypothetical protein
VGVSVFLVICFFVMVSSMNADMAGELSMSILHIQQQLPNALIGGLAGGGVAGVISGMFVERWQDL